jgi:hypothetical protein
MQLLARHESQGSHGPPADEQGNLTQTIDGQPITARYVVGRRMVGGEDEALSPTQYDAVTTGSVGTVPEALAAGALPRGSVGVYSVIRGPDGPERSIGVLKNALGSHRPDFKIPRANRSPVGLA